MLSPFASTAVFDLLKITEKAILEIQNIILRETNVISKIVYKAICRSKHLEFPQCHSVKEQITTRYAKVRLFSYLRSEKEIIKNKQKCDKNVSHSSRSLAMRQKVKNIKNAKK